MNQGDEPLDRNADLLAWILGDGVDIAKQLFRVFLRNEGERQLAIRRQRLSPTGKTTPPARAAPLAAATPDKIVRRIISAVSAAPNRRLQPCLGSPARRQLPRPRTPA